MNKINDDIAAKAKINYKEMWLLNKLLEVAENNENEENLKNKLNKNFNAFQRHNYRNDNPKHAA